MKTGFYLFVYAIAMIEVLAYAPLIIHLITGINLTALYDVDNNIYNYLGALITTIGFLFVVKNFKKFKLIWGSPLAAITGFFSFLTGFLILPLNLLYLWVSEMLK